MLSQTSPQFLPQGIQSGSSICIHALVQAAGGVPESRAFALHPGKGGQGIAGNMQAIRSQRTIWKAAASVPTTRWTKRFGEDRWKTLEAWPAPVSRTEKLYLGETTLNTEPAEGERTFVYDPETPVPSHGAESVLTTIAEAGSLLQPEPDYRPDVVSFVSAPLEKALPICGQIKVHLNVATDVDDTAFTAKLMEVFPDGRAYNIRGGITTIAADLPEGQTYTSGQAVEVCVEMWDMNGTVQPGSCLRLDVSSSDFPQYAVHSNYAGVWSEQGKTRIAHQKILLGESSFVELPLHEN